MPDHAGGQGLLGLFLLMDFWVLGAAMSNHILKQCNSFVLGAAELIITDFTSIWSATWELAVASEVTWWAGWETFEYEGLLWPLSLCQPRPLQPFRWKLAFGPLVGCSVDSYCPGVLIMNTENKYSEKLVLDVLSCTTVYTVLNLIQIHSTFFT